MQSTCPLKRIFIAWLSVNIIVTEYRSAVHCTQEMCIETSKPNSTKPKSCADTGYRGRQLYVTPLWVKTLPLLPITYSWIDLIETVHSSWEGPSVFGVRWRTCRGGEPTTQPLQEFRSKFGLSCSPIWSVAATNSGCANSWSSTGQDTHMPHLSHHYSGHLGCGMTLNSSMHDLTWLYWQGCGQQTRRVTPLFR